MGFVIKLLSQVSILGCNLKSQSSSPCLPRFRGKITAFYGIVFYPDLDLPCETPPVAINLRQDFG